MKVSDMSGKVIRAAVAAVLVCLCAVPVPAEAAEPGDDYARGLVEEAGRLLSGMGTYEVKFTAASEGMEPVRGEYVVDGDRFFISLAGQRLASDGVSRWQVNGADGEVIIDPADPRSRNILVNPARAFDFGVDSFVASYAGEDFLSGRMCRKVGLAPKGQMAEMDGTVELYIDMETGLPAGLRYIMDDDTLTVVVLSVNRVANPDPRMFVFDAAEYGDYEIIDFR